MGDNTDGPRKWVHILTVHIYACVPTLQSFRSSSFRFLWGLFEQMCAALYQTGHGIDQLLGNFDQVWIGLGMFRPLWSRLDQNVGGLDQIRVGFDVRFNLGDDLKGRQ